MPKLPDADYTANVGSPGSGIRGTRRARNPGASAYGGGIGRQLGGLGETAEAYGRYKLDAKEAHEKRRVQVGTLKLSQAFRAEMDKAALEGGDFDDIHDRYMQEMTGLRDGLETNVGYETYQAAAIETADQWGGITRAANAKKIANEARVQVDETQKLWGHEVLQDATQLSNAQAQLAEMVSTFGLNPEAEREFALENNREMAKAAADGLLLRTPGELKEILTTGEGLKGLTAGDTAQYIARAQAAIDAAAAKTRTLSWEQTFQLYKAMEARKKQGRVKDAERVYWEPLGATPAQFVALQNKADVYATEMEELHANMALASAGVLSAKDVKEADKQAAFDQVVAAVVEGLPPEAAAAKAIETRVRLVADNGLQDGKVASAMNAGAVASTAEAFLLGKAYSDALKVESPDMRVRMLSEDSEMMYDIHESLVSDMGLKPDVAWKQMSETRANKKEMKAVLEDKDLRDKIMDEVDDLAEAGDIISDTLATKRGITDRTMMYLAINPNMHPEQAVKLAAKLHEERTQVVGSTTWFGGPGKVRVPRKLVPVDADRADTFVRRVAMPAWFKRAGLPEQDRGFYNKVTILPNADGKTATVYHPDTGLPITNNFPWHGAVGDWQKNILERGVSRRDVIRAERLAGRLTGKHVQEPVGEDKKSLMERLEFYKNYGKE